MKIFTHTFKVTIYENGKFCWKNARWKEKGGISLLDILIIPIFILTILNY